MMMNHKQSIKEIIRQIMFKLNLSNVLDFFRRRRGFKTKHMLFSNRGDVFEKIYSDLVWVHNDNQVSRSGLGSETSAIGTIKREFVQIVAELECDILVDVGCGDWNWMKDIKLPCSYIGVDIVPAIIESNERFGSDRVRFELLDAVSDQLPRSDIALCREVLFHLSFADAKAVLRNMKSTSNWICATSDMDIWFNSNIRTGDFRLLNLCIRPFCLPAPRKFIFDRHTSRGRVLGVWNVTDMPDF